MPVRKKHHCVMCARLGVCNCNKCSEGREEARHTPHPKLPAWANSTSTVSWSLWSPPALDAALQHPPEGRA